jgi:hypothetical protein
MRPIDEMVRFLENENARPDYGEPIEDVFRCREPWCSNYELANTSRSLTASTGAYQVFPSCDYTGTSSAQELTH